MVRYPVAGAHGSGLPHRIRSAADDVSESRASCATRGAHRSQGTHRLSTLLVSDLHLDGSFPRAIAEFESFLAGPARAAAALYILGDLFESWVGDDDDDPYRTRVCEALRSLSAAGA